MNTQSTRKLIKVSGVSACLVVLIALTANLAPGVAAGPIPQINNDVKGTQGLVGGLVGGGSGIGGGGGGASAPSAIAAPATNININASSGSNAASSSLAPVSGAPVSGAPVSGAPVSGAPAAQAPGALAQAPGAQGPALAQMGVLSGGPQNSRGLGGVVDGVLDTATGIIGGILTGARGGN